MKRVKKILSMILCSVVIVSGSSLSLIKANAQTVDKINVSTQQVNSRSVAKQSDDKWVTKITLRFRHKWFTFDKFLWSIELACNKDGYLVLRGNTKIPRYYTFDDTYRWGYDDGGTPHTVSIFRGLHNTNTAAVFQKAVNEFNNAKIKEGQILFMYGENSNDSFRFENTVQPKSGSQTPVSIVQHGITRNDYSKGYNNVDKFKIAFRVEEKGLREVNYNSK